MVQIIREITVDVSLTNNLRAITAKQNDLNSRFLKINITDNASPLKVNSASKVTMNVKRTDNEVRMFYGSVNDDGSVTVPLTSWMLAIPGSINCDVSIISTDDSQKLTTMQFSIYVEEAVYPQEALEENENYDVLVDLLDAAENMQECIEATEAAEEAAAMAEDAAAGVRVVEGNNKSPLSFWVGTQAEYDAIVEKEVGCFYIISDDSDLTEILSAIASLDNKINNMHTPYNISNSVVLTESTDECTLIKNSNILILNIKISACASRDTGSQRYRVKKGDVIGTIEGYVPSESLIVPFAPSAGIYSSSTGKYHAANIEITSDDLNKNTIIKVVDASGDIYTNADLLGYFYAVFTCK